VANGNTRREPDHDEPAFHRPLLEVGKTLIDRFLPDPEKKREAEMELLRMAAQASSVRYWRSVRSTRARRRARTCG
jgi:hypothetical protein